MTQPRCRFEVAWFPWLCRAACALLLGVALGSLPAHGQVPEFMRNFVEQGKPASERELAERNVLVLNTAMMDIYEDALNQYKRNLRDRAPIVLALFSEGGGRLFLYRPGQEPLAAPPVPIVYQLAKSVSHSSMAIYQLTAPYVGTPTDKSWHAPMQAYRTRCQSALDGLDALELAQDDRDTLRSILKHNLTFMDRCLKNGTFTYAELELFARDLKPYLARTISLSAHAQVAHWMGVLEQWKKLLGKDWERTYAATNSLYVTRQNNVLFTILAQYMGPEAIGERLLLFETTEFTTTPEKMLDLLTRIVSDRALGQVFFKDGYVMDVELIGGGARKAIAEEATKRGLKPLLPPLAPFYSNDWPWRTDPRKGKGPASLEEIK